MMERLVSLAAIIALLLAGGCGDEHGTTADAGPAGPDLDWESYDHPPKIGMLDLSQVLPSSPSTYFELRKQNWSWAPPIELQVLGSVGTKCGEASDVQGCTSQFDGLVSDGDGFLFVGHPNDFFHYLAINRGDDNSLVTDLESMQAFVGDVDTRAEALLLVAAENCTWSSDDVKSAGIRDVAGGYEVICSKTTSLCRPIETLGYLLFVSEQGDVEVIESWVVFYDEALCAR